MGSNNETSITIVAKKTRQTGRHGKALRSSSPTLEGEEHLKIIEKFCCVVL
jgi:hypothetical protein